MKPFEQTPLSEFADANDFLQKWKDQTRKFTGSMKHKQDLRKKMLERFKRFDVEVGGKASIQIDLTCVYSKGEIECPQYSMWFSVCKDYHKFSARAIHANFLSKKVKQFECPECKAVVSSVKQFELDFVTYQYYSTLEDGKSTMDISSKIDAMRGELPRNDNETYMDGNRTVVWLVQRLPTEFKKFIQNNQAMQTEYEQKLRDKNDDTFLMNLPMSHEKPTAYISLLCAATQKRVLFPMLHKDCKHPSSITMFDLYSVMPRLYNGRAKSEKIQCPFPQCGSYFTYDDIRDKGKMDLELRNFVRKEPLYNISLKFRFINNTKEPQFNSEEESLKVRLPQEIKEKFETDETFRIDVKRLVKSFFKYNKLQEKKYTEILVKISEQNGKAVTKIKLPDGWRDECVPVRCRNCVKFDTVMDLWHYAARVVLDKAGGRCPLCKEEFLPENAEKALYIDYRMWEYTKQRFSRVVFYPKDQTYNVDIESLNNEQIRNILMTQNRKLQKYPEDTVDFQRLLGILPADLKLTVPLIMKSCIVSCNSNFAALIMEHLILKKPGDKLGQLQCAKCKTKPTDIVNLQYESLVAGVMEKLETKLVYSAKIKAYKLKEKLQNIRNIKELLQKLAEQNRTEDFKQNIVFEVIRKRINNGKEERVFKKYPAVVVTCDCHKNGINYSSLLDLEDLCHLQDHPQSQPRLKECPICRKSFGDLTLDDIIVFPKLQRALQNLGNKRVDLFQAGAQLIDSGDGLRIQQNTGTATRYVGLYDNIDLLKMSKIDMGMDNDKVEALQQLKKEFADQLKKFPAKLDLNAGRAAPEKLTRINWAGGINVLNTRVLPMFNFQESSA